MYAFVYVCTSVFFCVRMCVCLYLYMCVHAHTHMQNNCTDADVLMLLNITEAINSVSCGQTVIDQLFWLAEIL